MNTLWERSELNPTTSAWREWAAAAPPELLERFNVQSGDCVREVRARYPAICAPGTDTYSRLRADCVSALDALAAHIEDDHAVD